MMKTTGLVGMVVLGGALAAGSAFAQTSGTTTAPPAQNQSMDPNNSTSYATGKPLEGQSKEGFWGHLNPFARKKWVNRQVQPIKDRTNELDQLQAKNANDIRDVDARSQAGINKAMMAANTADQHAGEAANRARSAQNTATGASNRTDALHGTVQNLDKYNAVTSTAVPFVPGHTALGRKAKSELDEVAAKLENEKGYIVEVQGYSRNGVQSSQAMADSVVRYLVAEHGVPVYRIYRTGLGRNTAKAVAGETRITNGVRVTLLHNSLASMDAGSKPLSDNGGASQPDNNQ